MSQTYCFHKVLSRRELERYQRGVFAFSENQTCPWLVFSTSLLLLGIICYLARLLRKVRQKQEGKEEQERRGGGRGEEEAREKWKMKVD